MTREEYNLWFSSRGLMDLSWILGWDKNVVGKLLRKRRRGFLSLWATSALVFFMCLFTPSVQAGNLGDISSDIMTDNAANSLGSVFNAVAFDLMGPAQDDAYEELNDEENATMETLAVETPAMGIVTLGSRLASLRAGAASLFAFNIDREKDRGPILLASQNSSTASDAAARSDNSNAFSRLGFFLNGIGAFGDRGSTLNPSAFEGESGFDFETSGVLTGLDYRFTDEFILGTAFGYATTDADLDDDGGDIDADGYNVSVYGTYYVHQFYIDAIAGFGGNDYDATRNIRVSGLSGLSGSGPPQYLDGVAKADIDGWHYSFSVGAGYDFTSGGFNIGPYARLNYFRMRIDNYREEVQNLSGNSDVEGVGLKIEDQDIVSLATVVGGQVSYSLSTALGVFVPHVSFEWEHEYDNDSREVIAEYVHDDKNNTFTIKTDSPDRNFFNLGVGLSAVFPRGITAFVYYETPIGLEDVTSHNFTGGLRFEF